MMALFRFFGLGKIFDSVIAFIAKQFLASKVLRILGSLVMLEGSYLLLNNSIQYFIDYLFSKLGGLGVPPAMCWALQKMDFYNVLSFYVSVLISFAFAKYFLRMAERFLD